MNATSGSGLSKAASELLQEMQKAQEQLQKAQEQQKPENVRSFQDVMKAQQSEQIQGTSQVSKTDAPEHPSKKVDALQETHLNTINPKDTTAVGTTARAQRSEMSKIIEGLANGQDQMTEIMKVALSGRKLSSTELLAMQAGIFRFTQELEITSKVVEKATSGIKQTMNTQV